MADKKNAKGKKKAKGGKDEAKGGKPIKSGGGPDADADPPIIISGGSVTIESKVFLSVSYDVTKQRYIYEAKDLKITKMKMKGKNGDQKDDSDNGKFNIELSDV